MSLLSIYFYRSKANIPKRLTSYVVFVTISVDMDLIRDIDCFLLDLDGTVYIGDKVIDGAIEAVKRMQATKRVIFLTNNSSKPKSHYIRRLSKMGFEADETNVYTSANATSDYLKVAFPALKPYIVASPELISEFAADGIPSYGEKDADSVILTFDKTLTYEKLVLATRLIEHGAKYIATHPDLTCPDQGGDLPDIGSFIRLIEGTTNRLPDIICGKPYPIMADCVERLTGIDKSRIAMVGDRLYTDTQFAIRNGLKSVLVLSGETDMNLYNKSGLTADAVLDSIARWDA